MPYSRHHYRFSRGGGWGGGGGANLFKEQTSLNKTKFMFLDVYPPRFNFPSPNKTFHWNPESTLGDGGKSSPSPLCHSHLLFCPPPLKFQLPI